ncbi:alanine dehydrogenase [Paeniglutamicibacter cryotolerans]|uniref:Alanine dehydrogenase n=1 Tax=Paeniglutamicibacter cryotolerans TaxID=670079 RepID=A0A839QRE3_9MICC|nr:alanine dehydrogenase [Paeniglutamicibacter cryotolerans]MBB2994641.1 alanine dehydrogenase [Paeniglutamicibacter cryotolerans]
MIIGVPKEVKNNEFRVAITPAGVAEFMTHGHEVVIEAGAGLGSGITDGYFAAAGARILEDADAVWSTAGMVLKVKEPQQAEYHRMHEGQILFTYLHLAASAACTNALLESGTTAIAYETVASGRALPLLAPMSEVAGRLAAQIGAVHLQQPNGGSGILMGGVPGTRPAKVVVIGGGVAGENAAVAAVGMGADVTIIDISLSRLKEIDTVHQGRIKTLASSKYAIGVEVAEADLVIGSVLIPGAAAPKLVTLDMVERMRPGSVLVDIAIDQGGCFEGSHATTHEDPTFKVHDAIYYCVGNMPGAVPQTSTAALTNATLPYALRIADKGWEQAMREDAGLAEGLNIHAGQVTYAPVAEALGLRHVETGSLL